MVLHCHRDLRTFEMDLIETSDPAYAIDAFVPALPGLSDADVNGCENDMITGSHNLLTAAATQQMTS